MAPDQSKLFCPFSPMQWQKMDATKNLISEALEQLLSAEFKKFVWHLWNGVAADIEPIPRAALENADRQDVVDRMVQKYSTNAGTVAVQVLLNINQNDLAKSLDVKLQKGKEKHCICYDLCLMWISYSITNILSFLSPSSSEF